MQFNAGLFIINLKLKTFRIPGSKLLNFSKSLIHYLVAEGLGHLMSLLSAVERYANWNEHSHPIIAEIKTKKKFKSKAEMSWIFGIIGNQNKVNLKKVRSIHPDTLFTHETSELYIAAGGIKDTLHVNNLVKGNTRSGWCVVGLGIKNRYDEFSMMSREDWNTFFKDFKSERFSQLNGHFAAIRWEKGKVECYTDQLGLRNLYLTNLDGNFTIFSTRLDWVAKCNRKSKIDLKQFGAQWLLINHLSNECTISHIDRLSQGGKAVGTSKSYSMTNKPWSPSLKLDSDSIDIGEILKKLTVFFPERGSNLSLSLSGGLDSRVLLALLLSTKNKNWNLISFGDPEFPDNVISKKISSKINIQNIFYEPKFSKESYSIPQCTEFVGATNGISPISALVNLSVYDSFYGNNVINIDGGFGEIARRRYLNKLLFFGKKVLLDEDIKAICKYLQVDRSPIFNKDAMEVMHKGNYKQVENIVKSLPEITDIGVENWLDLLAIQTRLPNMAGYEQSRIDSKIVNYMPFVQPVFLEALLNTKLKERRNARFFKEIINKHKILTKIPLTKDGVYYSFKSPNLLSSVTVRAKKKFGFVYNDNFTSHFLKEIDEFVRDSFNSLETRNYEPYDHKKISKVISEFYKGETKLASEVDWWLTFDVWRRNVEEYQNFLN